MPEPAPALVATRKGFDSFADAKRWLDNQFAAGRFPSYGAEQAFITRIEPAGEGYIIVWLERSHEFPIKHRHYALRVSLRQAGRDFWGNNIREVIPVSERHWWSETKHRKAQEMMRDFD